MDEVTALLEDQLVRSQTIRGSPFIKVFEVELQDWEETLCRVRNTLTAWLTVQSQWIYLEPIFTAHDILLQMPQEGKLFKVYT